MAKDFNLTLKLVDYYTHRKPHLLLTISYNLKHRFLFDLAPLTLLQTLADS